MNTVRLAAVLACCQLVAPAFGQGKAAGTEPLDCSYGPASKTFGATQWLVYACSDKKSVAIVANAGNPAQPFYFFFTPAGERYRLVGEGSGSKAATQAAYNQLSQLGPTEIRQLAEEARSTVAAAGQKK